MCCYSHEGFADKSKADRESVRAATGTSIMSARKVTQKLVAIMGGCVFATALVFNAVRTAGAYIMSCVKSNEPSEAVCKENSDSPIRSKTKESPKAASKEPPNTAPKLQGDETASQEIELRLQDARSGRPFDPAISTRGRPVLVGERT